ncbi:MAG: filamentous hemagglutinin N-terminal domain-containing protein, partial [Cyanobacteria bacterium J06598_4]
MFATAKIPLAQAQVTSDNTTGTQVTNNDGVAEITGGETRGDNLFHSFQDFSVPMNNEAFFNNADNIGNIFSRVTGGNISNIDGIIRANGSANLFLVNPAGIMFGEGASLNLGGSFYGSTADSILFEDGEFSAADLDSPPLLTVNAPIGFSFRDNPGDIASNGANLIVTPEQTLALLGGNINVEGETVGGSGSNVRLGSLTQSGTIDLNENGSLSFPELAARGNVSLSNEALVFVQGNEGSSININAANLSLTSGTLLVAGIASDSGFTDAQAGDISINLTEDLTMDNSAITNSNFGMGNSGNVKVEARNVLFANGGTISNFSDGISNIGSISIMATEDISFEGVSSTIFSGINNTLGEQATGTLGTIDLTAQNLNLEDGGGISSAVANSNDSGDITVNVADTIRIDGTGLITQADGTVGELPSIINSNISGGNGNSGNIKIDAQNLLLNNGGAINAANLGTGNSGDIDINVDSLSITERGVITGAVFGAGNGGDINIDAEERVSVMGNVNFLSFISAGIGLNATGEAGNIKIETPQLILQDAAVDANVFGAGNGGDIDINAEERVTVIGSSESSSFISADIFSNATGEAGNIKIETPQLILQDASVSTDVLGNGEGGTIDISASDYIELSNTSLIQADVSPGSTGNGGNLNIETGQLTLNDGSQISATTLGNGNAGNVTIIANESISLSGVNEVSRGGIFASAIIENGDSGNIDLTTGELTISDGAIIAASNFPSFGENSTSAPGTGEPGNITIAADNISLESEGRIEAVTQSETGTGANISLEVADTISLRGSSFISAEALGNANGGNLSIDTNFIVAFPNGNNDIIASAAQGQGGNIDVVAESLLGIEERPLNPFTNDINASSEFGLDGDISIDTPDINPLQGAAELPVG